MKKYYEAAVNIKLKFHIGIPADSREDAERKLKKITRNNGENPDNLFLDMVEDLQNMASDELFDTEEVENEDYEVSAEIKEEREEKEDKVQIIRFSDRSLIKQENKRTILKLLPGGEQEMVTEEMAGRMILGYGGYAVCKQIAGTDVYAVCNDRCVLKIDGEEFTIGPVFIFDGEMKPISQETVQKAAEIFKKNRVTLCADGREVPAYRISSGKGGRS